MEFITEFSDNLAMHEKASAARSRMYVHKKARSGLGFRLRGYKIFHERLETPDCLRAVRSGSVLAQVSGGVDV